MDIREEFEKLEDVKQGLRHCYYNESTNDYHADVAHEETHEWHTQFVNGAWYAFQEQQKIVDMQERGAKEIILIINSIVPYEYDLDTMSKINKIKELLK